MSNPFHRRNNPRRRRTALALIAVLLANAAQALTITGVVRDPEGEPVPGALVWAMQHREPMADTADAEGRFAFEGIQVGSVDFAAHADGFAVGGLSVMAVGDAGIELTLGTPEPLSIRVTTTGIEPIAGARVLAATINGAYRVAVDDLLALGFPSSRSDDEGHLDITWLPAGSFAQLEVGHHRFAQAFVPYLIAGSDRQTVVLRNGQIVGGRVVNPEGEPLEGARVSIFSQTGSGPLEVAQPLTAPDGFFNTRVREGEYFVVARHPRYAGAPPVPLAVGPYDPVRLEPIEMRPPATVRGMVSLDDGSPAAAVRVAFLAHQTVYSSTITDRDGRFEIEASPEPGALQVSPPRGYYLPDGPLAEVTPVARDTVEADAFLLAPLPLIQGRVVDRNGEPVPRAILSTYDLPTPLHTTAGEDGAFAVPLDFAPSMNLLTFRVEHPSHFERALFEADISERGEQEIRLERYEPDMVLTREGWTPPNNLEGLVGRPAPALTTGDWYHSEPLSRADLRGKVVVLTFWGGFAETGATPDLIAEMMALHAAMNPDEVVFIALHDSASLPEDVLDYIIGYGIAFPVAQDSDGGESFSAYGVTVIPQTILIDREGVVRHYDTVGRLPELIKVLLR